MKRIDTGWSCRRPPPREVDPRPSGSDDAARMLRPDLAPLDVYLGDAMSLGREEFLERYPWPVLVVPDSGELVAVVVDGVAEVYR